MMVAGNPGNSIPYPKRPEWVAALKAVGKAPAKAAKVVGPAAARVIGGAAAVIIGTQAGSGEMPDYLLNEETSEGDTKASDKPPLSLPDDTRVVRGGSSSATPDGIKPELIVDGDVKGVSIKSAPRIEGETEEGMELLLYEPDPIDDDSKNELVAREIAH